MHAPLQSASPNWTVTAVIYVLGLIALAIVPSPVEVEQTGVGRELTAFVEPRRPAQMDTPMGALLDVQLEPIQPPVDLAEPGLQGGDDLYAVLVDATGTKHELRRQEAVFLSGILQNEPDGGFESKFAVRAPYVIVGGIRFNENSQQRMRHRFDPDAISTRRIELQENRLIAGGIVGWELWNSPGIRKRLLDSIRLRANQ